MPCDRRHLPQARCVACAVRELLVRLVLIELPDARVLLEQRTRILTGNLFAPIRVLTAVRWRADIQIQTAPAVERDPFVRVLKLLRQSRDDRLHLAGRLQLTRRHLPPHHRRRRAEIEIAVAQRDAGAAAGGGDDFFLIELAVAVRVAQRDDAARVTAVLLNRDVDVAVRRDGQVARRAESLGGDHRAKPVWKLDAAVIRIACGRGGVNAENNERRDRHRAHRRCNESASHLMHTPTV